MRATPSRRGDKLRSPAQLPGDRAGRPVTGVMTIWMDRAVSTANRAAEQILGVEARCSRRRGVQESVGTESLQPFVDRAIEGSRRRGEGRAEITLYRGVGRQVLLCRHSPPRRTPAWQPARAGIRRCHRVAEGAA